jgi:hypothetical protein
MVRKLEAHDWQFSFYFITDCVLLQSLTDFN